MTTFDEMDRVLDTFSWAYPAGDQTRGEITLDRQAGKLVMTVYANDNDNPDSDELYELVVSTDFTPDRTPARQIRELIHWYLTHEADEQMFFAGERPFYGHDETGRTVER